MQLAMIPITLCCHLSFLPRGAIATHTKRKHRAWLLQAHAQTLDQLARALRGMPQSAPSSPQRTACVPRLGQTRMGKQRWNNGRGRQRGHSIILELGAPLRSGALRLLVCGGRRYKDFATVPDPPAWSPLCRSTMSATATVAFAWSSTRLRAGMAWSLSSTFHRLITAPLSPWIAAGAAGGTRCTAREGRRWRSCQHLRELLIVGGLA
jgi:hypothetical protein